MLTLALLRHAKSSWDDPAEDDFARPLNSRGQKSAPEAGRTLAALGVNPAMILCSPSRRTRETLALALPGLGAERKPEICFDENLYLATGSDLLDRIRDIDKDRRCVLVIGHNPGLHSLAVALAGHGDSTALSSLSEKYPTAALALFTFDKNEWHAIAPGGGRLQAFWTPKEGLAGQAHAP